MKVVVSDLTYFLTFDEMKRNVDAINEFVKKGNVFILATSKAMNYLAEDLSMINLDCEYYICNNGAVIFDRYFNVVYRKDIKQELVRPIYNQLLDDDNTLEAFIDTSHGYAKDTNKSANGIVAHIHKPYKANILLEKICRKYPEVHGYIDDIFMNIIDANVDKASAVKHLINSYNYAKENVIVTGMNIGDYNLIKEYKGYTFENSVDDLKTISIETVKDVKELIDKIDINDEMEFILED